MADGDDLDDARLALALFRYRLIADAITAPRGARAELLRKVAGTEHQGPCGDLVRVTVRTLERWIAAFARHRLLGLVRRPRRDRGTTRAITAAALERAIALRNEGPDRSTPTLICVVASCAIGNASATSVVCYRGVLSGGSGGASPRR